MRPITRSNIYMLQAVADKLLFERKHTTSHIKDKTQEHAF